MTTMQEINEQMAENRDEVIKLISAHIQNLLDKHNLQIVGEVERVDWDNDCLAYYEVVALKYGWHLEERDDNEQV